MHSEELEIAILAYKAYGKTTDFKNYQGLPMPEFKDLPDSIKQAWINATQAVVQYCENS